MTVIEIQFIFLVYFYIGSTYFIIFGIEEHKSYKLSQRLLKLKNNIFFPCNLLTANKIHD